MLPATSEPSGQWTGNNHPTGLQTEPAGLVIAPSPRFLHAAYRPDQLEHAEASKALPDFSQADCCEGQPAEDMILSECSHDMLQEHVHPHSSIIFPLTFCKSVDDEELEGM